ncbi:MAG: hypothetical protein HS115_18960 [Spirochaetales bacterium]|nr:hypothetical protein [Spirochaetales bacterium]
MSHTVKSAIYRVLEIIHLILLIWGFAGMIQYFFPDAPILPLQNPSFPAGVQFLHWFAILSGGLTFLLGSRWPGARPAAMGAVYAMMATLCAVETLEYLKSPYKYAAMVAEYMAYTAILLFLFYTREARTQESP